MRISAFASVAIHWLPGIIERFANEHPKVELEITAYEEQVRQEEDTWHGEHDCMFCVLPTEHNFYSLPLAQDPLYIVVAKDSPYASADYFPAEAMSEEPYIKVTNDTHTEMDILFETHKVNPSIRFEIDNDFAVMAMIEKGLGYGVFSKLMMSDVPFDLALVEPEIPTHRQLGVAVRDYGKASIATRAFLECTRNWVADQSR